MGTRMAFRVQRREGTTNNIRSIRRIDSRMRLRGRHRSGAFLKRHRPIIRRILDFSDPSLLAHGIRSKRRGPSVDHIESIRVFLRVILSWCAHRLHRVDGGTP